MPGMTDQQQRDMEAQFRADLAAARRERDAFRARLESAEAALRDAQESRFALIVQNEELGAELAATRARLESAEKERDRLRAAGRRALDLLRCGYTINHRVDDAIEHLRAACERSEG